MKTSWLEDIRMVGRPLDLKTDAGMEKLEAGVRAQLQRALEKIDRGLEEASEGRALVLAGRARCCSQLRTLVEAACGSVGYNLSTVIGKFRQIQANFRHKIRQISSDVVKFRGNSANSQVRGLLGGERRSGGKSVVLDTYHEIAKNDPRESEVIEDQHDNGEDN